MIIRFTFVHVQRQQKNLLFLSQSTRLYFLFNLLQNQFVLFLIIFFLLLLDLPSSISISKHLSEVFETSQSHFRRFENIDPYSTIDPHLSVVLSYLFAYSKHSFCQLLRVLVEDCQQSVHEPNYHLDALNFWNEVLLKYFKNCVLVLSITMLEEGKKTHGRQGQKLGLLVYIMKYSFVDPQGSGMYSSWKRRIKTLS